ncbi:PAS domain S-box protein [Ideonella sp. YS5]|uniref:PAS domain-containing hybrid sensor histidine kinase/response regulator n=1 Tax=Ideonella sp. YS5 TaxID=3453714 RepID=UPI003EEB20ED
MAGSQTTEGSPSTARQRLLLGAAVSGLVVAALASSLPDELPLLIRAGALGATAIAAVAIAARPLWRALAASRAATEAASQHLAAWLAVTSHAHIELDRDGRVVGSSSRLEPSLFGQAPPQAGLALWKQPAARLTPAQLQRLRDAVRTRAAWPEFDFAWDDGREGPRPLSVAGVPRHDANGRFAGHWALLRDRRAEVHARDALKATETRLHDLFRRVPLPLVLHRAGAVMDANPAAVELFGYRDLHSMLGSDMLRAYAEGEDRERARERLHEVAAMPLGQTLPAAEYRLRPLSAPPDAAPRIVQVSSAPVELEDGRATLSIYTDETERRQAEQAVQRSEALLSHLVSTSPDAITLTDLANGRYAMVNRSFERITGYRADEVIGRTSGEIAIWAHDGDRTRLVQEVRSEGSVQNMAATFRDRQGRYVQMLMSAARFGMDGRDYLVIAARDVTASEQARLEREAILNNALMGIALTREQHFILVNPRFEQMFGWPPGLLVGQHGSVVWPTAADHQAIGREVGPALGRGEQIEIERPLIRRDGSVFLCRLMAKALSPTEPGRGGTIWLAEDVTEKRQVEQALAKARDDAEAASRAKSAFLANTSHEIRTPLNALLGLARLARQPGVDESRRRQYIEQISDSAETLSGVLSDILDLSKIEAGKMHLEEEPFDLQGLLRTMHQAYGSLADTKGLDMSVEIDEDLPPVVIGDPVRVRQILSNYLNNALKFTESGCIRLSVRRTRADRVRFEVTDTGPGIDEAQQALLFRAFSQADVSRARRVGGTGLGLSICRQLAEMMGGEVGLVSLPGQGSCFWAEVPLAPGDLDALESGSSGFGADPISGTRVLMVEDNAVNMMIAVALLEQWGVEVSQAGDGQQAVELVQQAAESGRPFDIVLMDVQMPGMSGHEATRLLRRDHPPERLPIIALTAAALVSERDQALAAGMNDFLTKPIDAARLRNTLVRALRTRDVAA